ncbi:hypothetical protein SAMN04488097_3664 [Epilithonimonas lactis]|uniref:Uncharacterized protein n=2 Tax=Epilithonimonas lactis TaxID=421072 RepID=A0A085B7H7_9FLAO|nr:hypothetical protein IO89_18190 [Epilithonimonas lactis]SER01699.1 hypothetical protein SAMN04488097_3664 [Epilithonimonas lactis]
MYKYFILIISLISLQSCGQNKETMDAKSTEILGNLYKDVKHIDQRINYQAMIFIGGCNYEVLINDYPVDRYFGPGNGSASGSTPINIAILKPGVQNWKIRIYPVRDRKEVDGKVTLVPQSEIQPGARVELDIEGVRFGDNGGIEKRFGKVVEFRAPTKKDEKNGQNILNDAGKPYIEYSGTFEADVPYTLAGWQNSTDLNGVDANTLKQQLLKQYENFHKLLQDGNLNQIANQKLNAEKEIAQAYFYDKKTNDKFLSTFIERWGQKGLKMKPIENYKVALYGDGKIATLIDVIDGGSPLWGNYEVADGKFKNNTYLLYFHIPKGKKELEVIR